MVKSFAQPVIHAEFLADSRTLRISDKLARNLSRQTANNKALADAQTNHSVPVVQVSAQSVPVSDKMSRLGLRPNQLRALKFDDAMFHAILNSIAQREIIVENSSSRPLHVVRHDVLRNLLHAKMETGWYNGANFHKSMTALDSLADISVSSITSGSAPVQLRGVNGQIADLTVLLGEIINRFISPAMNVCKDVSDQFHWQQDTSKAQASVHDTLSEAAFRGKCEFCKELGSKDVGAYGTAPLIYLQGMENGPPIDGNSSNEEDVWRV
jgi:hypothetical protein